MYGQRSPACTNSRSMKIWLGDWNVQMHRRTKGCATECKIAASRNTLAVCFFCCVYMRVTQGGERKQRLTWNWCTTKKYNNIIRRKSCIGDQKESLRQKSARCYKNAIFTHQISTKCSRFQQNTVSFSLHPHSLTYRNALLVHGLERQHKARIWVHHQFHATVIAFPQHP